MKKTILLLSFFLFTVSLTACESDDDGSITCACNKTSATIEDAEYCVKTISSGDDCPGCRIYDESGGTTVSSCGGKKIDTMTVAMEDGDCRVDASCYGLNEAGEDYCAEDSH